MKHLSLDGNWRLKIPGRKRPLPATVPGCIHTDLMSFGLLKDPVYRDNIAAGRVSFSDEAVYEREFNLNPIPENEHIYLSFLGLDTLATVTVNGNVVAKTDNMLRPFRINVTDVVKAGRNSLSVAFKPVRIADTPDETGTSFSSPAQVRKRKIDFGCDYSPSLPTEGIWRSVYVEFANCARILSVIPKQEHVQDSTFVSLDLAADVFGPVTNLNFYGRVIYRGLTVAEGVAPADENGKASIRLEVHNAQRWWPNGMGDQPLYELQVELVDGRKPLDYVSRRIGLRTYRLERDSGKFNFFVNDKPMLIRGANWTTPDIFTSRPTRVEYARLIKAANVANLNMLRVTGDGIYEQEYFYDLCDEYGICVWQDFMFSDMAYPFADPDFQSNIRGEVEEVLLRLARHTCLAIWCGGDDVASHIQSKCADGEGIPDEAYDAVFGKMIPGLVSRFSPDTPYIPDAASSDGVASVKDTGHDKRAYSRSPAPFYTAFGFPSLPEIKRFEAVALPEDLNPASDVFKAHITRASGIKPVNDLMLSLFKPPRDFTSYIALSQIQQGLVSKTLVEHWRRLGKNFGGGFYTRLNDSWPGLSESSLDSEGHWKVLHYFARRFYGNLLVTGIPNAKTGTVEVFVHNNSQTKFSGKIKWRILDTSGHLWREMEKSITVESDTVIRLGMLKLTDLLQKVGPEKLLVWLRLLAEDGYCPSTDCVRFAIPKNIALEDPHITTEIRQWDDHCYAVTINADKPALWCWLDFVPCAAKFDENFICVAPGQPVRIRVTPVDHFKLADFRKGLKIQTLYDTFKHN